MVRSEDGLELTWEQHGDFAFPYENVQLHLHGIQVQQAWVDEKEVAVQENYLECDLFSSVRVRGEFAAAKS